MSQPVAVLDANVLVPVLVCDLLLCLFDAELFQPAVSPTILVEVERSLSADFPHLDSDALQRRVGQMAQALALHTHDVNDAGIAELTGVNRKDRHVVELAIACRADIVVTNDRRLRREIDALDWPTYAISADEFVLRLLIDDRDAVETVINLLITKRTRQPITWHELITNLSAPLPRFAAQLRDAP